MPHPLFDGFTPNLTRLSCHVSTLLNGHSPHAPHTHGDEEELLLILSGEADLLLPEIGEGRLRVGPGEFVYYPVDFPHSLTAVSDEPVNYLMLKWNTDLRTTDESIGFSHFDSIVSLSDQSDTGAFRTQKILDVPTGFLRKLHCHLSFLSPGAGYEPHGDEHDVVLIALDGVIETVGERVEPNDVCLLVAGEAHGMENPGTKVSRYLVIEFHGSNVTSARARVKHIVGAVRRRMSRQWFLRQCRRLVGRRERG